MRRMVLFGALAVGVLFAALVAPGTPVARWLLVRLTSEPRGPSTWPAPASQGASTLRVAVGAMISPERTFVFYGELFEEVGRRLGRPVELVQRSTYGEVNSVIEREEVDVAWICTGAWPELARGGKARLLVVPVVGGRATYRALVVAGPTTKATDLRTLRGARFAYTDPLSLTGCAYPRRRLAGLGETPERFFASTFYTHAHDVSIETVRRGFADAASVDELVFEYLRERDPAEVELLRVIERSQPFPIPPLVVPSGASERDVVALQRAFLELEADQVGQHLLRHLLIDRFVLPDASAYESLR